MADNPEYNRVALLYNEKLWENHQLRKRVADLDRMATVMRQEIDVLEKALREVNKNHPALTQSMAIFRAYVAECERQEASDG